MFKTNKVHGLELLVLKADKWTPELAFVAVQNYGMKFSIAIFNDHPMFKEFLYELEKVAQHLKFYFFKNYEIIRTFTFSDENK